MFSAPPEFGRRVLPPCLLSGAVVGSAGQRNMMAVMMRWEDPQWHARDDRDYLLN